MFIYKQVKEIIIDNLEKLYPVVLAGDKADLQQFFRKQSFIGLKNLIDGVGISQKELLHSAISYGILASLVNVEFLSDCDVIIGVHSTDSLVFNEKAEGFLAFEDAVLLMAGNLKTIASATSTKNTMNLAFLSVCAKLESTITHQLINVMAEIKDPYDLFVVDDDEFLNAVSDDCCSDCFFEFSLTDEDHNMIFETPPMELYKETDLYDFYKSKESVLIVKKVNSDLSFGHLIEDTDDIDEELENFIDEDTFSGRCPISFSLIAKLQK